MGCWPDVGPGVRTKLLSLKETRILKYPICFKCGTDMIQSCMSVLRAGVQVMVPARVRDSVCSQQATHNDNFFPEEFS